MAKKKRLIPFWMMPGSWGLSGKTRATAEAEYYLTGTDLEFQLAEIHGKDEIDIHKRKLAIQLSIDEITQQEYDAAILRLDYSGKDLEGKLEELKLANSIKAIEERFRNGELKQHEMEKEIANLKGEPYVGIVDLGLVENNIEQGFFELDWNDDFVAMLHKNGFTGHSDEAVVNKWFNQICRTILIQENADYDFGFQQTEQENTDVITKSDLAQKIQGNTDKPSE
jgi:hypothetical protein